MGDPERVGFVGLGIMGRPMAFHVMRAGHPLVVRNGRGAAEDLKARGAEGVDSCRALAEACPTVITCLPDTPDVVDVWAGEDGLLAGAAPGTLLIDMSTISPDVTRDLAGAAAERGVATLDAPVSGGEPGAVAGELSIMVGGREEDFARAQPLLRTMGTPVHVGGPGSGQTVKACNQVIVGIVIEAVSEALVLASKAGVDPVRMIEAVSGGLAGTKVMQAKRDKFLGHDFAPGFRVALHHKDMGIALATARAHRVALPVTAVVDQMLQTLLAKGRGGLDHSALLTVIEDASEHRL